MEDKFFERKIDIMKQEFQIEYLKSPMFLFSREDFSISLRIKNHLWELFINLVELKTIFL